MSNWLWLVFVAGTVICWGSYGPTLHRGQMALGNSAWKAILCVGGAYFILALVVPIAILKLQGQSLSLTRDGVTYAGLAGALGALGAICIAASIWAGGKPITVMPLVFGCAPVVNVLVSMLLHPPERAPDFRLYLGTVVLAIGAWMVLHFKP